MAARRAADAPSPLKVGGDKPDLGVSRTALLLVDFINPLRFDGADHLARGAIANARSRCTRASVRKNRSIATNRPRARSS